MILYNKCKREAIGLIIDFHTHCFPDELAMKAVPSLSEKAGIPAMLNGTLSDLKRSMEASCITGSVLLNIATKPSQAVNIHRALSRWDVISSGASIRSGGLKNELTALRSLGSGV